MSVSAVVLTKNEEKNIAACLETLTWCDEILVIDDASSDNTADIAKRYHAKVIFHSLDNDFAKSRNFGLQYAKGDWVLFIDADERVSAKLQNEIKKNIDRTQAASDGYYLKRQDVMWGKPLLHGEQGATALVRLARKNAGKWIGAVHEVWQINGATAVLQNPLIHYPHQTIAEFLQEINTYSSIRAKELQKEGVRASWFSVLVHAKGKFFQNYFLKLGFLDGIEGFIAAMAMSLHAFLVRGKLWQLTEK